MLTLYVFDADTLHTVAAIQGTTHRECEAAAWSTYGPDDRWGWTFSPPLFPARGRILGDRPGVCGRKVVNNLRRPLVAAESGIP